MTTTIPASLPGYSPSQPLSEIQSYMDSLSDGINDGMVKFELPQRTASGAVDFMTMSKHKHDGPFGPTCLPVRTAGTSIKFVSTPEQNGDVRKVGVARDDSNSPFFYNASGDVNYLYYPISQWGADSNALVPDTFTGFLHNGYVTGESNPTYNDVDPYELLTDGLYDAAWADAYGQLMASGVPTFSHYAPTCSWQSMQEWYNPVYNDHHFPSGSWCSVSMASLASGQTYGMAGLLTEAVPKHVAYTPIYLLSIVQDSFYRQTTPPADVTYLPGLEVMTAQDDAVTTLIMQDALKNDSTTDLQYAVENAGKQLTSDVGISFTMPVISPVTPPMEYDDNESERYEATAQVQLDGFALLVLDAD